MKIRRGCFILYLSSICLIAAPFVWRAATLTSERFSESQSELLHEKVEEIIQQSMREAGAGTLVNPDDAGEVGNYKAFLDKVIAWRGRGYYNIPTAMHYINSDPKYVVEFMKNELSTLRNAVHCDAATEELMAEYLSLASDYYKIANTPDKITNFPMESSHILDKFFGFTSAVYLLALSEGDGAACARNIIAGLDFSVWLLYAGAGDAGYIFRYYSFRDIETELVKFHLGLSWNVFEECDLHELRDRLEILERIRPWNVNVARYAETIFDEQIKQSKAPSRPFHSGIRKQMKMWVMDFPLSQSMHKGAVRNSIRRMLEYTQRTDTMPFKYCPDTFSIRETFLLADISLECFMLFQEECANATAISRVAICAIRLDLYRREHGEYPEDLAPAVQESNPHVSLEPWMGTDIGYAKTDDGYFLAAWDNHYRLSEMEYNRYVLWDIPYPPKSDSP